MGLKHGIKPARLSVAPTTAAHASSEALSVGGARCAKAARRLREGCAKAARRLLEGCSKAARRLREGCAKAARRLRGGCAKAARA
ncbi:MAG: hypothetical protein WDW38_007928 [Sanguina aurantia]